MSGSLSTPLDERLVRGASLCQTLHWLAQGRLEAKALTALYLDAIARENPRRHVLPACRPMQHATPQLPRRCVAAPTAPSAVSTACRSA